MQIIGKPTASKEKVKSNAYNLGANALFLNEMTNALWDASLRYDINPVGVIAQAAKETNWGKYGGKVTSAFFNTCGLKIRDPNLVVAYTGSSDIDQPLAHAIFPSWTVGGLAHVQHLRAYVNWPVNYDTIVDPRYIWVIGKYNLVDFEELSGKWAPSATYGKELVDIANKLSV